MRLDSLEEKMEKNPPRDEEIVSPADKGKIEIGADEAKIDQFINWMMDNAYSDPVTLEEINDAYDGEVDQEFLDELASKGILNFNEEEKTYTLGPDSKYVVEKIM